MKKVLVIILIVVFVGFCHSKVKGPTQVNLTRTTVLAYDTTQTDTAKKPSK